ncbi:hypothetical protein VNO77_17074 [Canavalia gladiata]|uniref:Receptor-like serine/threonine-protein kinase n=1 Tax=Canavalia gladiata TaxID=3824 RepID=A0AAN9QJ23_CANGL
MMLRKKIEILVLFMYFWLWWSSNSSSTSMRVKAEEINDSLKAGNILDSETTLYSKQSKYCLFFSPIYGGEEAYLMIFHVLSNEEVWLSDRSQPVDLSSAVLWLNQSGVLKIESRNGEKPIILYSPSNQATNNNKSIVATLLDTGNFVLQDTNGTIKSSNVLWQSFDYPAYTLVPTMKLGLNRSLISPLTGSLSVPGAYSLEWEQKAGELVIKRRGKVCWRSGKLNKSTGMFSNIPEKVQRVYEYTVEEEWFSFSVKTESNDDKFMGWMLMETGRVTSGKGDIARADMCYGYNSDGGCERWEDIPSCRERGDVQFYPNGTGCTFFLWNSTEDVQVLDVRGVNLFVLVNEAQHGGIGKPKAPAKNGKKKWTWICAVMAAILLIVGLSVLCLALKKEKHRLKGKKRMEANTVDLTISNESSGAKDLEDDLKKGHDIKVFNYTSVLEATNGFSPENKLGQGGFGPVYKGILSTRQEVAVKRLSKTSGQGVVEFKNELTLIGELQHTNLVQLLGCCIHEEERILIYEYMPNKSLDFYLFDCTRSKLLDWKKRWNIIEGISQGLLYLHKYSRLKVIHRDLKASNILLDENMNPKISDFGMARMFTQQESIINTNRIVGTYGYMSPEYAMEGIFSTKSDVYSFGVLVLEIVSGRRNNCFYDDDRALNLIGHAWELWDEGECLKLADATLNDTFATDEVQRCIHVGLLCVEQLANDRPTMSNVVSMLANKSPIVTLPRRPAFYPGRDILERTISSQVSDTTSTKVVFTSPEVEQGQF